LKTSPRLPTLLNLLPLTNTDLCTPDGVPTLLESPGFFGYNFQVLESPGKSWKFKCKVLESPGIF